MQPFDPAANPLQAVMPPAPTPPLPQASSANIDNPFSSHYFKPIQLSQNPIEAFKLACTATNGISRALLYVQAPDAQVGHVLETLSTYRNCSPVLDRAADDTVFFFFFGKKGYEAFVASQTWNTVASDPRRRRSVRSALRMSGPLPCRVRGSLPILFHE